VYIAQMNKFSNMQLFVLVVQEGSFSATARTLGITPSSVSRQISQLEGELGARLFQRTTRKQSLTEAGKIYFQHAERIIADMEAAQLAVNRLTDTPSGSLHITAEADFALVYIAPLLPDFLERYPEIKVRLSMNAGLADLVDGGIDMAIRIGHLGDSSLIARKIAMSESVVCASPAYIEKHGSPSHPSELEAHNCLSFRVKAGKKFWTFKVPEGSLDVPISGRIDVNSIAFLRHVALDNQGVILVPKWIVRDEIGSGLLLSLLDEYPLEPVSTPIHAVFAHNRHLAPKVRVFVDFLVERMKIL
jgi:DNA-binding transcriptional LysR family regulator